MVLESRKIRCCTGLHANSVRWLTLAMLASIAGCDRAVESEEVAREESALINGTAYGTSNTANQDPNLVGIYSEGRPSSTDPRRQGYVNCSGVVVGSLGKHVLTSGHCVTDWRNFYTFKGNINDGGRLETYNFTSEHKLTPVEVKNDQAHVVINTTFLQIDGKRKKTDPVKPWPSDMALLYLAMPYGTGLSLDCNALPSTAPAAVRVHTASTQGKIVNNDIGTLSYPFAGKRGTKTYGDFDVITDIADPLLKPAVTSGVRAGMYVIAKGKNGEYMTGGDSGGPAYSLADPNLLVGLLQGGNEPRREHVGEVGWIAPFKGKNCDWLSAVTAYSNVLATYYDDLDGDGVNDIKLLLQSTNGGSDLQLVASASITSAKWPVAALSGTYNFPGAGSFAPTFVAAGKYLNSAYYSVMANNSEIRLYSVSDGKLAANLGLPTGFQGVAGLFTARVNQDSLDDLILLDNSGATGVYLGSATGLTRDSSLRFTATKYDADSLVDYMTVVGGKLFVAQSSLGYAPLPFDVQNIGKDVVAGRFSSSLAEGRGQFLILLNASASDRRVMLCTQPHDNGCSYVDGTTNADAILVDDVNHDGYDDILVTGADSSTKWYFGGGSGSRPFTASTVSDVNGDGLSDFNATLPSGTKVFLLGTAAGAAPAEMVDLDKDNDLDIRFTRSDGSPGWWTNTGTSMIRDVPRNEFAVFGSKWIGLNNGTVIYAPGGQLTSVGGFGEYPYYRPSGNPISVMVGSDTLGVDIWSKNLVSVSDRATVEGDIWTSQALSSKYPYGFYCGGDCATVTLFGKIMPAANQSLTKGLSDVVYTFASSAGGLQQPNGTLAPGAYDKVIIGNDKTVTFSAGRYSFNSLKMEPRATVKLDSTNGPIYLLVKTELIMRATPQDASGRLDKLFIGYWGSNAVGVDVPLAATLVAPNAQVSLNSTTLPHRGAVFADSVVMHQYGYFEHHRFAGAWPGSPGW